MAQKKRANRKNSPWFVLFVLLIVFLYYHYAETNDIVAHDLTNQSGEVSQVESDNVLSKLEIYFWNVGQADSILLTCGGQNMLIDAGNNADGKYIVNQLNEMEIKKIDYLVGTHPHEDHVGGIDNIIYSFKVGKFYMPNRQADSKTFEDILDAAIDKKLKVTTPKKGSTFKLGEAECKVISAESDAEDTNDSSIVIQVTFGKHKYLFTGDLTSTIEEQIEWEDIDVLKVAHHGSRYSSSKHFLDETKPEIAIISDGKNNEYGHPHKEALNRLKNVNAEIYRTDKNGTIYLSSNGRKITINFLDVSLDGNRR